MDMKRWLSLGLGVFLGVAGLRAAAAPEDYARAVRAYAAGDLETAETLFRQVVATDPGNTAANAFLARIAKQKPPGGGLRARLEKLIVPKVDFRDASLGAVIDYLPKVAAEQKVALNLVRMFPADYGTEKKISLSLENVPMTSVLDYVAQLGGLKLEYQAHAVVLSRAPAQ